MTRRVLRLLLYVLVGALGLVALAVILIQTPWVKDRLRAIAERQIERATGAEVSIGGLTGSLFTGAVLHDVRISGPQGPLLEAPRIAAKYSLADLLIGGIDVRDVRLERPTIHLRRTEEGVLNLAALGGPPGDDPPPDARRPGRGWSVGGIALNDATVTIGDDVVTTEAIRAPERLTNLDATVGLASRPAGGGLTIDVEALSFQAEEPALAVHEGRGTIGIARNELRFDDLSLQTGAGRLMLDGTIRNRQQTPTYDLQVGTRDLSLSSLGRFVPAVQGYALSPTVDATLTGTPDDLKAQFDVRTAEGRVAGDVRLDATGPARAIRGQVETENLNLAALQRGDATATDITSRATIDLTMPGGDLSRLRGTYDLTARELTYGEYDAANVQASGRIEGGAVGVEASADIYGGRARTTGTIRPFGDGPIQYDLTGQLRGVDPSQLPGNVQPPGAPSMRRRGGGARPAAAGSGTDEPHDRRPRGRQAADAGGIDLDFSVRGRGADVQADTTLRDVSLAGADFGPDTRVQVSREGGRLRYSASGSVAHLDLQQLGQALGMEALTSARFASDVNATFDLTGSGTALDTLTLQGTATLERSTLLGATLPELTIEPDFRRGAGTVAVRGRFEAVDIGAIAGRPGLESSLQGRIDAQATFERLANPDLSPGALEARGRLTLHDSTVAGIRIDDALIDARISEARATIDALRLSGPDLEAEIAGTLALTDTGASDLTYLIDTPALQRFESFGVPARGEALLQGRVTGNRAALIIDGTLSAANLAYGDDAQALSATSRYEVRIPDLTPARASVTARTELADVEAAGRSFASIQAETTYADGALAFDTRLTDVSRTLTAAGRLLWHPDHQEVHLRALGLDTPAGSWTLTTDEALIRYGGDALEIRDLTLASRQGGELRLEGRLGTPPASLAASVRELQLDTIDDLLLDEPLSGVLTATATISGPFSGLSADATFAVTGGEYRGFAYQSAGGTIAYTPSILRLDVRVDQSQGAAFTAAGVVPLSAAAGDALDLVVQSTPIDLGLVQLFTDELQEVDGTAELDVRATGSLAEPRLRGSVHVRGGAFTLVVAQSRYRGFETTIDLEPDVVNVREFHLLDDEGNRLRIGGQLGLAAGEVREVDIEVHAGNFEVADNRLAELNVDADLRITGSLMRPRVGGRVALVESLIRVDRILEIVEGPYDTTAVRDEGPERAPGAFAPAVDITLDIPESLVIQGRDLRAPGGVPIGLGDMNITLGGDLQIRMPPGGELRLSGEVQTVRGTYEFQGRQFTIERDGRILFMGTPEINPRLDIRATREISGVVASVQIGGVLEEPELTLSSNPPLEDAEILSLIVFNQPLSLLGAGEQVSLATRATALASGFVASQLTASLSDALELDVLDVEATDEGATGLAPVVTVGEQFGQLFVKLRQRFGPEAVSEAVLEYRLAEWLRLQTSFAQGDPVARSLLRRVEAGGLDLLFFFSY